MKRSKKLLWLVVVTALLIPLCGTYAATKSLETDIHCDGEDAGDENGFE